MDSSLVINLANQAINVVIQISAPLLILSGIVGLCISLLKSIFQIQDPTLTFIPKAIVILLFIYNQGNIMAQQLSQLSITCIEVLLV